MIIKLKEWFGLGTRDLTRKKQEGTHWDDGSLLFCLGYWLHDYKQLWELIEQHLRSVHDIVYNDISIFKM